MPRRHPDWLKVKIPGGKNFTAVQSQLARHGLNTVCAEARCPNLAECYGNATATFLLLGKTCTRSCRYCNIVHGTPQPPDAAEPLRLARAVRSLRLVYVVLTSVTRDDLADGGAAHFARAVENIRTRNPHTNIELLVPDFNGSGESLREVLSACPDILGHNIEVVEALFPGLRPQADYQRSLGLLKNIKAVSPQTLSKSGLMLGLGESYRQIQATLADLKNAGVEIVSLGQYLQPSVNHAKVVRYYTPPEFEELKAYAMSLGFRHVESSPLTRSSYHAERALCRPD